MHRDDGPLERLDLVVESTGMNLSRARNQGLLQRGVPKARTRGSFRISHVGVSRFEQFVRSDIFHYLATGPQSVMQPATVHPRMISNSNIGFPRSQRPQFRVFHAGDTAEANMPLRWMLLNYCVVYILAWLLFTFWWQHAANDCESRDLNFRRAFLLSLETGIQG